MPQNVSIAYRGAHYAIGQGPQFYGIWHAAAPEAQPIEWWPLTPDGWTGAWTRFAAVEVPGTIVPVAPAAPAAQPGQVAEAGPAAEAGPVAEAGPGPHAGTAGLPEATAVLSAAAPAAVLSSAAPAAARRSFVATGLIGLGIILGIVGLFPSYVDRSSLASTSGDLVPHLIYLAAWGGAGVLILLRGARRQAGALLGLGVSVITLGLFLADAGLPISGHGNTAGAGLVLSIIGWAACTAGVLLALLRQPAGIRRPRADRLTGHDLVPAIAMVLAAVGAAIAFAPSWDRYLLQTAAGASQTETLGNAFANPAAVIAGDVLVMVLFVAAVVAAVLWRPARLGAALAAGAIIPLVAQAISAVIGVFQATPPQEFGISPAIAQAAGLTITNGLTAMFWVYCAFVATLILLTVWMLAAPAPAAARQPLQPFYWPGPGYDVRPPAGQPEAVAEAGPTEAVPAETVPTETVPTETVPTEAVPTETVPATTEESASAAPVPASPQPEDNLRTR